MILFSIIVGIFHGCNLILAYNLIQFGNHKQLKLKLFFSCRKILTLKCLDQERELPLGNFGIQIICGML